MLYLVQVLPGEILGDLGRLKLGSVLEMINSVLVSSSPTLTQIWSQNLLFFDRTDLDDDYFC